MEAAFTTHRGAFDRQLCFWVDEQSSHVPSNDECGHAGLNRQRSVVVYIDDILIFTKR